MKRKQRLPKIVCREIFASDNWRVYEISSGPVAYAVEIHQRMPDGHGRMAYIDGEVFQEFKAQTHYWAEHSPVEAELDEYLDRTMHCVPTYPLDLH